MLREYHFEQFIHCNQCLVKGLFLKQTSSINTGPVCKIPEESQRNILDFREIFSKHVHVFVCIVFSSSEMQKKYRKTVLFSLLSSKEFIKEVPARHGGNICNPNA